MARQHRIEYAGALYHVMARGDRRESIVCDDEDRQRFISTLDEACGRTGFVVYAYVLLPNHYHIALETPEPNLVDGMRWLQNTYTRRYNVRHKLWGHVFGGRYKALLIEDTDPMYLRCLIDYIHLNPVRAGLVERGGRLEDFPWSSLREYVMPPGRRSAWMSVDRLPCNDERKLVIAEAIHSETALRLDWIRDVLKMGARAYCSQLIGQHKSCMGNSPELRAKKGELLEIYKNTD